MVSTRFEDSFPEEIVRHYTQVRCATVPDGTRFRYIGPPVEVDVADRGVQHFVAVDAESGQILANVASKEGRRAFDSVVIAAHRLGRVWKVRGGPDVFDPATGVRWTQREKTSLRCQYLSAGGLRTSLQAMEAMRRSGFDFPYGRPAVMGTIDPGRNIQSAWKNRRCLEMEAIMAEMVARGENPFDPKYAYKAP